MKIAVTSSGEGMDSVVDARLGRAERFILVDTETGEFTVEDNTQNLNAPQAPASRQLRTLSNSALRLLLPATSAQKLSEFCSQQE